MYNQQSSTIIINKSNKNVDKCKFCGNTGQFIVKNRLSGRQILFGLFLFCFTGWLCFIPCCIDDFYDK